MRSKTPSSRSGADVNLDPCPFCGGEAEFERQGTGRQSCIVTCTNCGARHESGDTGDHNGSSWNSRYTDPVAEATARNLALEEGAQAIEAAQPPYP
jgi:Lar family restriction alleviation protein